MSDPIEMAIAKIQEQEVMAVSEMDRAYNQALHNAIAVVKGMPSAQPDLSEYSEKLWRAAYERGKKDAQLEIVYCRECIHWRYDTDHTCRYYGGASPRLAIDFCSKGERRTDE